MVHRRKTVVIVGGGVAALETAIGLHESLNVEVDVKLITPERDFHYRPFAALEPFGFHEYMRMPVADLVAGCNVEIIYDKVSRVDLTFKRVALAQNPPEGYDALLISTGAQQVPGVRGAITVGGPDGNDRIFHMLSELDAGVMKSVAFVVPAGASWTLPAYEFAMLTTARARHQHRKDFTVHLVTPERSPLQAFGPDASDHVKALLATDHVKFHGNEHARSFSDGVLTTATGTEITVDRVIALPHLVGHRIPGLPHDGDGFLPVDPHGRVADTDDVYAAGDITNFSIKQGSIAAQQADAVVNALAARFGSQEESPPFHPQLHAILFSERGRVFMRAPGEKVPHGDAAVSEEPLWENAEKIFSRHLSQRMRRLRAAKLKVAAQ